MRPNIRTNGADNCALKIGGYTAPQNENNVELDFAVL